MMKITDKVRIKDKEYMCTQIFLLKEMRVYRVHNTLESKELFIIKKDDDYEVITDEKVLNEINNFLQVKSTDNIIKY